MEEILNEVIDPQDIMKFEKKYKMEEAVGKLDPTTKFEYAWCLVRSKYKNDWKTGVSLLEELYRNGDKDAKRDYIFYLSVAHYKLKHYDEALKFCDAILKVEPKNHQAKELKELIEKTEKKEGYMGMAIIGGASLAVGVGVAALAGILAAASRSK